MGGRNLTLLACLVAAGSCEGGSVGQPIPFNHRIHAVKAELKCESCHEYVFEKPFAGLPRVEICIGCHEEDLTKNPAAKPHIATIRRHAKAGTEIPWVRLYRLPATVYYSHRRHAKIARLPCATCHGDIGQRERPPDEPIARTLEMSNCMDCHARSGVENDCAWCHR